MPATPSHRSARRESFAGAAGTPHFGRDPLFESIGARFHRIHTSILVLPARRAPIYNKGTGGRGLVNDSAATVSAPARSREGLWYGLAAYGWWGLVPLYFKALDGVDPFEILAHRIVWSMLFLGILLSVARRWGLVRKCLTSGPLLRLFLSTALLIALNWYFYIYSVATEQMVQSSLGYFMTPLVSVALGMLFLGERLRRLQAVALGLAGAGVV